MLCINLTDPKGEIFLRLFRPSSSGYFRTKFSLTGGGGISLHLITGKFHRIRVMVSNFEPKQNVFLR